MKMFQLKMYMAISGRAPERGSGHNGGSSPQPPPRLSRKSVSFLRYLCREERSPSPPPPCCHPLSPLGAGTQISESVWCREAFMGTEAKNRPWPLPLLTTLSP